MSYLSQFRPYIPQTLVQKFTITMGTYTTGGLNYWTLGSAKIIDLANLTSISSTDGSAYLFSPLGPSALFCFVNLGRAVNPNKTFLKYSHSGHSRPGNQLAQVRLYNWNGSTSNSSYPSSLDTEAYQVQVSQRGLLPTSSDTPPEVAVEVIEYL